MDFKLELVLIPVSDVDRAKAFYVETVRLRPRRRPPAGDEFRVVQITPPGSACSITIGIGHHRRRAGLATAALHLVVTDIEAARAELVGRGVEVSEIRHMTPNGWEPGPDPEHADYGSFADFSDPDGNTGCCRRSGTGSRPRDRPRSPTSRLRGADRAPPARAARPLLPDARVVRRGRGRRAGDVPARVAQPRARSRAARCSARGSTASRRTSASTCSGAGRGRLPALHSFAEVPWLQPYPDRLLDEVAPSDDEPDAVVVERETIELAFLAALQVLPPRQRAALIARDVLGWPADRDRGAARDQRRRGQQRAAAGPRDDAGAPAGAPRRSGRRASRAPRSATCSRASSTRTSAATRRPPSRSRRRTSGSRCRPTRCCSTGSTSVAPLLERAFGENRDGDWRLVPTRANRMPTAASYLRRPGDTEFRAFKFDVLRIEDGAIAEITTFGAGLFPAFGLPPTL